MKIATLHRDVKGRYFCMDLFCFSFTRSHPSLQPADVICEIKVPATGSRSREDAPMDRCTIVDFQRPPYAIFTSRLHLPGKLFSSQCDERRDPSTGDVLSPRQRSAKGVDLLRNFSALDVLGYGLTVTPNQQKISRGLHPIGPRQCVSYRCGEVQLSSARTGSFDLLAFGHERRVALPKWMIS